jgi:hypothetical protein
VAVGGNHVWYQLRGLAFAGSGSNFSFPFNAHSSAKPMRVVRLGRSSQPSDRCVISLGIGRKGHTMPLTRLEESLQRTGFQGDFLVWKDELPPGSPTHMESPMAFKTFCFLEAMKRGYRYVLWIDAPCIALRSINPIFTIIRERGYVMFVDPYGQTVGQWCGDDVLERHAISREAALSMPEIPTSVIGLDLCSEIGRQFFDQWHSMALDGVTFRGTRKPILSVEDHYIVAWNKGNCISSDSRVGGHRHDQTAAGIVAHRLGMTACSDGLRDVLCQQTPVDRGTMVLHHREFGEEIKSLHAIYRETFFSEPFVRAPRRRLRTIARRLKHLIRR